MVKASYIGPDGKRSYVFGLSAGNLKRLKKGQPIAFDLEPLGGAGRVMIMFGETEEHIAAELRSACEGDPS